MSKKTQGLSNHNEPNPFEASFQDTEVSSSVHNGDSMEFDMDAFNKAVAASQQNANMESSKQTSPSSERSKDGDKDEDPEVKRLRFLERNRIAASKCRQKKKQWMQQLASQADQAAQRNKSLQVMVNQLKDEVLVLKNQLLAHRNCSCNVIQQYIQSSGQFATMNVRPNMNNPSQSMSLLTAIQPQGNEPNSNINGN